MSSVTSATACACCDPCMGDIVVSFDVPNDQGYETYAGNLRLADDTPIAIAYECRRRGGTATLCGHSEFTSPSTPPKKYRKRTGDGTLIFECIGHSTTNIVCSGEIAYDSATCAASGSIDNDVTSASCSLDRQTEPTVITNNGTGEVCPATGFLCPSGWTFRITGSRSETLTEEDTEADALTRLLAGSGGTWGAWTLVGGCAPESCCFARWAVRTTGFSFAYGEAQWRVAPVGQSVAAGCYRLKITYYRRVAGSGAAWVEYAEEFLGVAIDGSGNAIMYQ